MYSVHSYSNLPTPRLRARVASAVVLVGALGLTVSGLTACEIRSPLDRIDLEAQRILASQQARALGPDGQTPRLVPPTTPDADQTPTPQTYAKKPPTHNPPADRLEPGPPPPSGRVDPPAILDDGTRADTLRFDLEGLLAHAIAHSPEYQLQRESLFLDTLALIIERHEWGPRFFSIISGIVTGDPEGGDTETAVSLIGSLGVTQRLPYGGTVSAAALVDYVSFLKQSALTTVDDDVEVDLELSVDLPLLRGAGRSANTVEALIQTERNLIYAVRDFERFRREFFVDLATTYLNLVTTQRQLANQERQLRNLEESAELFIALAEAGREPYFQAERAEQRALRARNSLINQQERYVSQLDTLKIQIGVDTTRPVEIVAVEITVPENMLAPEPAIETAYNLRLDLQTVADRIEDARRGVLIARNQLLPDLDLTADTSIGTQDEVGVIDFQPSDTDFSVALALGLPLDRKIEYADYRASLIGFERQQRDFRVERDRIALSVRNTARAIEQARFILQLQNRAVEINERRAEQVEINQRSLGPRDVIEAQEDLLDARNDRDEAIADLRISILEFLLATGQLRVGPDGQWLAPGRVSPEPTHPPYDDPAPPPAASRTPPPRST
ncbi:MAG: TolC family protein [Planctomycetota bacterium]